MKKHLLTSFAALTFAMIASNAQTPMILGENHAMVRLDDNAGKYILLPVEEKAEIANVRVVGKDNNVMHTPNVKLAVNNTDYYVPLKIGDGQLLDIIFHGERRHSGNLKDYVCWREMKYTDNFDTSNREKYRPVYHHTPRYGWMNDPNGMFYKDGVWHLYYQWNPYGSQWENMNWGHSTSRDLIHWEPQPLAIEPDGLGTIFSGSCVTDKDKVVAFYTSAGQSQTQSMAVSTDNGQTFTKYEKNPILTADIPDFRDPNILWHEGTKRWIMILAAGQEVRIYSSANLKDWTYESSFGKEYGNHGGVWECPDLMELPVRGTTEKKWMLVCNINPGGPFGGSATQYFIGDFDGKKFTCESMPKVTKWMDYGKDHYATVSFYNAPDNRRVVMAWMSNWQYANDVPTQQYRSANSIPRDLDLYEYKDETYCGVTPSKEMLALRGKKVKTLTDACEVVVDIKSNTCEILLSNSKGEQVKMVYDEKKQTFAMDRTKSGNTSFSEAFPTVTTAPVYGNIQKLRIFIDHSSIEAFDAEGRMAMTNLVFPTEPYTTLKVKGGKANVYNIER